jgi:hypothetical protein
MIPAPDRSLEDLDWSPRTLRLLKRVGCRTIADVLAKWPYGIARVSGVGAVVMREIHERLGHLIVDVPPVPQLPRPRRGAVVSVPYIPDRQTFLEQAAAAWEARAEHERRQQAEGHRKQRERSERTSVVESQHIRLLRCFQEGLPIRAIAARWKCAETVLRAKRQRLIRQYARPPYLARLPEDLQRFILEESKRYMTQVLVSRTLHAQGMDARRPSGPTSLSTLAPSCSD